MPYINVVNPYMLLFLLAFSILLIIISKEFKKSVIMLVPLVLFLSFVVTHTIQFVFLPTEYSYLYYTLSKCILFDVLFIVLSFISYLWVDEIEAKEMDDQSTKKSVSWFWKEL